MKYIVYNKNTKKVIHILDRQPVAFSDCLAVAQCETIPQGKKFMVTNIQEKQEEYTEKVTETVTLATGETKEIIKAITKTKPYMSCDLIALY